MTGTDCHILTQIYSKHSSTSFSSWLGLLNHGSLRAQALCLQADSHAGILSPNWLPLQLELTGSRTDKLKPSLTPGYIIVWHPPASCGRTHLHRIQPRPLVRVIFRYLRPDASVSLLFCLFTQVHLLIDGSVEGHYVTSIFWVNVLIKFKMILKLEILHTLLQYQYF